MRGEWNGVGGSRRKRRDGVSSWDPSARLISKGYTADGPCPRHTRGLRGMNLELVYIRMRLEVRTCEKELGRLGTTSGGADEH